MFLLSGNRIIGCFFGWISHHIFLMVSFCFVTFVVQGYLFRKCLGLHDARVETQQVVERILLEDPTKIVLEDIDAALMWIMETRPFRFLGSRVHLKTKSN